MTKKDNQIISMPEINLNKLKKAEEEEYKKIYQSSLDYYLNRCLKSKSYNEEKHVITEWDVAMVAKTIF